MPSGTVDTVKLTSIINECFANATDDRFSDAQQNKFLLDGKRLRAQLMTLLSAKFDESSTALQKANAILSDVNDKLADDAETLAHAATVLGEITTLVGTLDNLLSAAIGFL